MNKSLIQKIQLLIHHLPYLPNKEYPVALVFKKRCGNKFIFMPQSINSAGETTINTNSSAFSGYLPGPAGW